MLREELSKQYLDTLSLKIKKECQRLLKTVVSLELKENIMFLQVEN